MRSRKEVEKKKYWTIQQAAKVMGVHPDTLRRWDKKGIIKIRRHPINAYRLFTKASLNAILKKITG